MNVLKSWRTQPEQGGRVDAKHATDTAAAAPPPGCKRIKAHSESRWSKSLAGVIDPERAKRAMVSIGNG